MIKFTLVPWFKNFNIVSFDKIFNILFYFRPSSPLPLLFTTLNDRGNGNSNTINEELILLNDIKDSSSVNDQTLDTKTNNSDSENSIIDNPTEDVYDYYEDYYEAAYDNDQEVKSNIRKRSSSSRLANAAIIAAASAHT